MFVNGANDVQIATTDHGGGDIPLLLTHGAFFARNTLDALVAQLTPAFRVITFDMRNHGESGEGPWGWPLVTADVEAVRVAYGIASPVVAGHSLGGMVSAMYARDYPGAARAAINIDGCGRGKPSQYIGKTEDEVRAGWAAMEAGQNSFIESLGKPRLVEMMAVLDDLDMFDLWRSVPCPFQLFNCVADDPAYEAMGPDGAALFRAYRNGLQRDYAALAEEIPSIEIATVDKTHVMVIFDPEEAAGLMTRFASTVAK